MSGNGQGYDGKPSDYYQVAPGFTCQSKPAPLAEVSILADGDPLLSENRNDQCNALQNQPIPSVDFSSYNPDFVGYREKIFERLTNPDFATLTRYAEAWCKPQNLGSNNYDIVIHVDSNTQQSTAEIFFQDQSGNTRFVPEFAVFRNINPNLAHYNADSFDLNIDRSIPAPEAWWFYHGQFTGSVDGQNINEEVICRMSAGKLLTTVQKIYAGNGAWNSYVQKSDSSLDLYSQPDKPCTPTIDGARTDCFHGGEKLSVLAWGSTCDQVSIQDQLGAFRWLCRDSSDGAQFVTVGLNGGKGLRDLITGTSWRDNFVDIYKGGVLTYESIPQPWWINPVTPLPDNSAPGAPSINLTGAGTVFTLAQSRASAGYALSDDHQAIVSLNGSILNAAASISTNCFQTNNILSVGFTVGPSSCLIGIEDHHYEWIEADMDGAASQVQQLLGIANSNFDKIINGKYSNSTRGISLHRNNYSLYDSLIIQNTLEGMYSETGSRYDIFQNLNLQNNANYGIDFDNWPSYNFAYINLRESGSLTGIQVRGQPYATFNGISVQNNTGVGLHTDISFTSNQTAESVLAVKNTTGFWSDRTSDGVWSDIATFNNSYAGARVEPESFTGITNNKFTGNLIMGGNASNCKIDMVGLNAVGLGIIDPTCTDSGLDGSSTYTGQLSDAILNIGCSVSNNAIVCSNRSWPLTPSGSNACPAELASAAAVLSGAGQYYLPMAVEIIEDGIGNDNGLCEAGESCYYRPLFQIIDMTTYDLGRKPCTIDSGPLKGTKVYLPN